MKIPDFLYSRPATHPAVPPSLVLLAWLDSSIDHDVQLGAILEGKHIFSESAIEQFFPGGISSASRVLPWLDRASSPIPPICAYAAIVAPPNHSTEANHLDSGHVRSAFVLHPTPDDVMRLEEDFRRAARQLAGGTADEYINSVRPTDGKNGRLEINVFEGGARRAGREIALSDGEFAVATIFALNRQKLSREQWCDKLWPNRDSESAGRLLKAYVHRIRARFGISDIIESQGGGYRLGRGVHVDVHALEDLVRKYNVAAAPLDAEHLRLVQRAFEGFQECRHLRLASIERFDELERRLVETGVELARLLIDDAIFHHDTDRALTVAEHLQTVDPSNEIAAELLIRTHLRLGRPEAARRYFNAFCRTLRAELDLPPPRHLSLLIAPQDALAHNAGRFTGLD